MIVDREYGLRPPGLLLGDGDGTVRGRGVGRTGRTTTWGNMPESRKKARGVRSQALRVLVR